MHRLQVVPLTEVPNITFKRNDGPKAALDSANSIVVDEGAEVLCEEKARLAREYHAATSAFSEAVKELHRKIGTSPKEEYKRLERISTEAPVKSEQARLALEQHIFTHRF